MNISEFHKKTTASEDLTVVLLRGNGSPRSFRLSLAALHRSLTALGFVFALAILTCFVLLGFSLLRPSVTMDAPSSAPAPAPAPVALSPAPVPAASDGAGGTAPAPVAEQTKPGLWQQLKESVKSPARNGGGAETAAGTDEVSLKQELAAVREDMAKLQSQVEGRKDLSTGAATGLLQFFGPRSTVVPEGESMMRIRNAKVIRDAATKQVFLDFELHNVDPAQALQRGYIVAFAKSPDVLVSYPPGVFAPSQNVVLNFAKGETFAVARFRQARATFSANGLDSRRTSFQVILFAHDGKVLGTIHAEDNK